ncbi:alpha/beta fold hydrolase [Rhodobacteraceae bacterium KMM 6894]|nr:alpha/beta fold hydrolase [Rhodobacteraceae bacterium KMM 6894]
MKYDQDERSLKLVEMIYRTALDPQDYNGFMSRWNDWVNVRITGQDQVNLSDPTMSTPQIAAHFELALRLMERMNDAPERTPGRGPRMLVHPSGQILWQNAEADRRFGTLRGKTVQQHAMSDAHRERLQAFLSALNLDTPPSPVVIQMTPCDASRPIAFRAELMRRDDTETSALISALNAPWSSQIDYLLIETHGLSDSECAICALLADGTATAVIAQRRGTSVATVRTQIKKILSKTQTNSQIELVAHLNALQRMAESLPTPERTLALTGPLYGRLTDETVEGRQITFEEHGPADGRPVLFLHGMLDGTGATDLIRQTLNRLNLRLICPHRPSFGTSSPHPGAACDAPERLAADLAGIWKRRGIARPVIVGHMAGAVYTADVACACQARGIVHVSGGVPILTNRQFDAMSQRQRLVAYTARYARSVLPFVVNAGIRQIKSGGADTFLASMYEHAPVDNELLKDREIRTLFLSGYDFSVAQGNTAFTIDSELVVQDWTTVFNRAAPLPVHLIHGEHDPVVAVDSVRDFAARHADRVNLNVVEDAGQLVYYQEPAIVFETVAALFD